MHYLSVWNSVLGELMRLSLWLTASVAMATTLLSGCAVGPDYQQPVVPLPAGWREVGGSGQAVWPAEDWWRGFSSTQLNGFVQKAEAQNYDIAAAVARIREADGMARVAGAPLLPSVGASSGTSTQRTMLVNTGRSLAYNQFSLGLNASYQIDFWGKNHAALEAAKETAIASRYDEQVIALATVTSVAVSYFQALALQDRIAIAQSNLGAAEHILTGIQAQFRAGTASDLNIAQQETLVNSLRASIPPLRQQLSQAIDALAVLIGENPENVHLAPDSLLNLTMPTVAPGLPADLLERRPDVHEAEAQLISANANIKVARADFLPSVTLTASGGIESLALAGFSPPLAVYGLGAGIVAPIFEGGALHGQLEYSKARYDELLGDYRKSIVAALSNVEDGLAGIQQTGEQLTEEAATVATAQRAYDISAVQYKTGTVDMITLLTTENTLFPAEDQLVQVRLAHVQALVSMFQALGGGWQNDQLQTADAPGH
jgi:outer membrane protein, multidrug efflux system